VVEKLHRFLYFVIASDAYLFCCHSER